MTRMKAASLVVHSEERASARVERPYSSAAVCQAAELSRATFDAWLLRRILPLPPGPGTGRERRFSENEAILVSIAAALTKALSITGAAHVVEFLNKGAGGLWPRVQHEAGWILVAWRCSGTAGDDASSSSIHAMLVRKERFLDLEDTIEGWGSLTVMVVADVSKIVRQTLQRLTDPAAAPAPKVAATIVPERLVRRRVS